MAVLVSSQLAAMSVLDAERADAAAREVAESNFTAELLESAVYGAVAPVAGESTATIVAATTSQDPRVREMIRGSLVLAHQQVVDPDAATTTLVVTGPDTSVRTAVADAVIEAGIAAGVDLTGIAEQVEAPSVLPDRLPEVGLRPMAETTRTIAAIVVLVASVLTVVVHPRPGRGLAGVGWKFGIVFGGWFVALVVVGWVIDSIASTLFGELLQAVWSDAVPAMLLLCGAGLLLCAALWFGGIALDGLTRPATRYPPST
jgi:hypothetical protein